MGFPHLNAFSTMLNGAENINILQLSLISFTIICFLLRYVRLVIGIWANLTYKAAPVPLNPTYTPKKDVTVVIPTVYKNPSELVECIGRVNRCGPKEIFIVLLDSNIAPCRALCDSHGFSNIIVLGVPKLGKRTQMLRALGHITTRLVVWADDDVFWPTMYLENLIAIFEDPKVGAGGTLQRVRRSNGSSILPTSFWNILGISYLERRVFNNLTTNAVDGSISTLSGRSSAVRTIILQNQEFSNAFSSDTFRGRVLNSDDDKFLTRWIYKHGWKIKIQRAVYLETTVEESSKYIYQCLRWVRARFRGNLAILRSERFIWSFPWGIYVIYFCQFQQPMLLIDITLYALLRASLQPFISPDTLFYSSVAFGVWLLSTKVVKMIPHFLRNPLDLIWLPVLILFAYFHSLLNVYALCTLTETSWGGKILEPEKEKPLQKPQGRKTSSVGR